MLGSEIAGLLVARLPENSTFLFFRKGRDRVVKWAGAPAKNISKQTGRARLHPRSSFSEYLELVEGTSEPWTPEQLRIAEELWTMLLTSERADLIRKTNRQQSLLIDELNHRVRNILALIRSLSHQSQNENSSVETYVNALEARISALAAAHDLGAEKTELSATLKQIIEQEAAPYNQDKERVRIGGGNTGIRSDLAPIFALVVHELMTNAAKYGALSEDAGTIQVEIIKTGDGVTLHWQERGGPTVIEPEARGFGTRLIAASVPNELGGAVEFKYPPSGLVVNVSLPADIMVEKLALESPSRSETCACNPALSNQELAITSETCLVLEDNYVVSLDTVRVLKSLGFDSVDTAFTASDALDKIARQPPSLAILDINLSRGLTSEPVAKELTARGVPFIFVTGYGDTQKLSQAFRSSPVLKKPLREDELRRKLHELFQ